MGNFEINSTFTVCSFYIWIKLIENYLNSDVKYNYAVPSSLENPFSFVIQKKSNDQYSGRTKKTLLPPKNHKTYLITFKHLNLEKEKHHLEYSKRPNLV